MATFQDIHALEQCIYDIVDDYIHGMYFDDDVLAIGRRCGKLTVKADARETIKVGKTTELYPLKDMVRKAEEETLEPDIDKILNIASSWIFLD